MEEMRLSSFLEELSCKKEDILFITSVLFNSSFKGTVHLCQLELENLQAISILNDRVRSQEAEFLDQIELIKKMMKQERINIELKLVKERLLLDSLPEISALMSRLKTIAHSETPFQIIFDITALPRRIILLAMEVHIKLLNEGNVSSIYIIYTWPLRYPIASRSTNTGSFRIENSNFELSEFIEEANEVHGIMTAGRDGSIGRLFLESIRSNNRVDAFFYVKKDDYLYALNKMLNNINVLSYIDSYTTTNYYLSISRGYEVIMKKVKDILIEWNSSKIEYSGKVLLLAPLGPKPMLITAFMAVNYARTFFKNNNLNYKSGIAHVTSLQQNDLYSIGSKETSIYKLNIEDMME
jgi:hypothetical protein